MIALALLLHAAGASAVADVDAANAALTQCLFASYRVANETKLPVNAFEERLKTACRREQKVFEAASAGALARRGNPHPASAAHRIAEDGRKQMIQSYRHMVEMRPVLERLAAICNAHPEQCQ